MQTISDMRELHNAYLTLARQGLLYAFPSSDPLDPILKATVYCSPKERARAIPLDKLKQILQEKERAFLATLN